MPKKYKIEVQATVRKTFEIEGFSAEDANAAFLEKVNAGMKSFDITKRMFGPDKAFDNIIILRTVESDEISA